MKVVLNGYGKVAQALLRHWKDTEADVTVVAIRRSAGQWVNPGTALQSVSPQESDFSEVLQPIDQFLKAHQVDVWFELTPTDLSKAEIIHKDMIKLLEQGIHLVFANKAPLLHDYMMLKNTADEHGVKLGLSAVMGASLPGYALAHYGTMGARILSMRGILNGSTNVILAMMEEGQSFDEALQHAIETDITEPHWEYDVDGMDSAVKMAILASVTTLRNIRLDKQDIKGIRAIHQDAIHALKQEHKRCKLVATFRDGKVTVQPEIFSEDDLFYHVNGTDKVLFLQTDTLSDMSVLAGRSGLREVAASMHRDLLMLTE